MSKLEIISELLHWNSVNQPFAIYVQSDSFLTVTIYGSLPRNGQVDRVSQTYISFLFLSLNHVFSIRFMFNILVFIFKIVFLNRPYIQRLK